MHPNNHTFWDEIKQQLTRFKWRWSAVTTDVHSGSVMPVMLHADDTEADSSADADRDRDDVAVDSSSVTDCR